MSKQRAATKPTPSAAAAPAVTPDRFARLYKLLTLIDGKAKSREALSKALKVDVRGFYRDLDFLRKSNIPITLVGGKYLLQAPLQVAADRLPFPNPVLTYGDALQLAKGKTAAHKKLQTLIADATK